MCEHQSEMWRRLIPAMALTCPVVHRGVLVLAAICLHHDTLAARSSHRCLKHLDTAAAHGNIFVKESRQKFQEFQKGLEMQDQDSILACSRLLGVLGFAFFRAHRQNGTRLADSAAWTWIHLLRGVKTTYAAVIAAGRPVDDLFIKDTSPQLCRHRLNEMMSGGSKRLCFDYIQRSRRDCFDALRCTLHLEWRHFGAGETKDLSAAIDLLDQVTEQVCSPAPRNVLHTICTWPASMPRGFVDMVIRGSPPALAIYAHWLMLMVLVEDLWWIGDMGRAGIRDVMATCSNADRDVRNLLIWPQQMLDLGEISDDSPS